MTQTSASVELLLEWAKTLMASRSPDFTIGENYMKRWWVIPRNEFSNQYLHYMTSDDDDRALHDHPWNNKSVILSGGYLEHTPSGVYKRNPGDVVERQATDAHRLELYRDEHGKEIPCISLFSTGPVIREWGFYCPQGWRHWKAYVSVVDGASRIGRGCD